MFVNRDGECMILYQEQLCVHGHAWAKETPVASEGGESPRIASNTH